MVLVLVVKFGGFIDHFVNHTFIFLVLILLVRDGSYLLRLVICFFLLVLCFTGNTKCFGLGANETRQGAWSHELVDKKAQPLMSLDYINSGLWMKEE